MSLEAHPTLQEEVGAALLAAGHDMAAYQPPRLQARPPFLGSCTPGWLLARVSDEWVLVAYRPAGIMSSADSYAVQAEKLAAYERDVFTAPRWACMWSRREGIPALLVRRAQP